MFTITFTTPSAGLVPGKLAEAELRFTEGPLAGLKLVGFAVWERSSGQRHVTFPARQYSHDGARHTFALLRPISDGRASDSLRDVILSAYAEYEELSEQVRAAERKAGWDSTP